ncbi:hypothetical protein DID88_009202 [Monilinia fructigena]|uniref:Major facilitator superfamily (MFS) profile domain-containing protein n=1 Tax=Monilinia fructigena TaxID=38457 RepID=A0A395IK66_9HELO|nr:hypothetical protein DID88_009202 [Monilinia fructigena]
MSTTKSNSDQFDTHQNFSLCLEESDSITPAPEIKLDQHGLPLVPQPSQFQDDPLNWPKWLKWAVLIQVGYMAFLGPYNAALINPSLILLSDAFDVSPKVAAYSTTTAIIMGGVSPFIYTPLSNIYGRRPVTLFAILLTIIGGVTSASSTTFSQLVGTRAICGFGFGGMMSVGTACVNDMFFLHQRGEATGVYSVFVTNGAHVASIIGGYLGSSLGWQWDYWIGTISTSVSLVFAIFLFPETLFSRDPTYLSTRTKTRTCYELLFDFRGNTLPNRVSLMIGSLLGEFSAGKASDYVMYRVARRNGDIRKPEYRLYLCCLSAVFMPTGLIIFGATVGKTLYFIPLIGLAIGVFGLQIASTTLYAYVSDCYKPQTPETGVLFNLSRGLSFVVGYFALPFADKAGFAWAWFTFAIVLFTFFVPVGTLILVGRRMEGKERTACVSWMVIEYWVACRGEKRGFWALEKQFKCY